MNQGDGANNVDANLQYVQDANKLLRHADCVKTRTLNPTRILAFPCIFKIGYHSAIKHKRFYSRSSGDDTEPVSYDECNHPIASKSQY